MQKANSENNAIRFFSAEARSSEQWREPPLSFAFLLRQSGNETQCTEQ